MLTYNDIEAYEPTTQDLEDYRICQANRPGHFFYVERLGSSFVVREPLSGNIVDGNLGYGKYESLDNAIARMDRENNPSYPYVVAPWYTSTK
jgi:hypothetical protein